MIIKTKRWDMDGSGSIKFTEFILNSDDISSALKCGYDYRPFNGSILVKMKNGDTHYVSDLGDLI